MTKLLVVCGVGIVGILMFEGWSWQWPPPSIHPPPSMEISDWQVLFAHSARILDIGLWIWIWVLDMDLDWIVDGYGYSRIMDIRTRRSWPHPSIPQSINTQTILWNIRRHADAAHDSLRTQSRKRVTLQQKKYLLCKTNTESDPSNAVGGCCLRADPPPPSVGAVRQRAPKGNVMEGRFPFPPRLVRDALMFWGACESPQFLKTLICSFTLHLVLFFSYVFNGSFFHSFPPAGGPIHHCGWRKKLRCRLQYWIFLTIFPQTF